MVVAAAGFALDDGDNPLPQVGGIHQQLKDNAKDRRLQLCGVKIVIPRAALAVAAATAWRSVFADLPADLAAEDAAEGFCMLVVDEQAGQDVLAVFMPIVERLTRSGSWLRRQRSR